MTGRSGVFEMSISQDSIKSQQLFGDFTSKGKKVEASAYLKIVKLSDRILIICHDRKDPAKFSAMTLINFSDKKYFQMVWNGHDTSVNSIETLIELNKNDHQQLFGYYFFNEQYVGPLKKMKPIDAMTLPDFKAFARVYVDKIKLTGKEFDKVNIGYVSVVYNFQLITQALYDIGYNPLQDMSAVEPIYKKYAEDPEVKKILDEAGGR